MRLFLNFIQITLHLLCFAVPFVRNTIDPVLIFTTLVLLTLIFAASSAAWWLQEIRRNSNFITSASNATVAINKLFKERNLWLFRIGEGVAPIKIVKCADVNSVMNLIRDQQPASAWLAMAALMCASLLVMLTEPNYTGSKFYFTALINSQVGYGLAVAIHIFVISVFFKLFMIYFLAHFYKDNQA